MARTSPVLLAAGFLVGVGASGLVWWTQPHDAPSLPLTATVVAIGALALLSALLVLARVAGAWRVFAIMLGCLPAAVILRVLFDTWWHPTSHNLWPFEVVLGFLIGVPAVMVGTLIGAVLLRLGGRQD